MKTNLRTPYAGLVDDRYAGARCEAMGAWRSVLFDRLRLPAIGYLQYTNYAQRPQEDFLKPYFELYLVGRQIAFERGEVVVFAR